MDHTSLREKVPGDFFAVCVIHVMAEWVRDRDDCLWDGAGMRNHHNSNMFMLPVLICTLTCLSTGSIHVHIQTQTRAHLLPYALKKCVALTFCSTTASKGRKSPLHVSTFKKNDQYDH